MTLEFLQKDVDEGRDLLPPLAQRGHPDLDDIETVVEILAELAGGQGNFQVPVGGGEDLGIGLEGEGKLADLVQEEGWPNSSDSRSSAGRAAQFTFTKG